MQARILGPGDETLLAAAAAIVDDDEEGVPGPERCGALLNDPGFVATVALEGGRPVGFIYGHVLQQMTRTALLIYSVDTDEGHRRRGAARVMIEALRQLCRERRRPREAGRGRHGPVRGLRRRPRRHRRSDLRVSHADLGQPHHPAPDDVVGAPGAIVTRQHAAGCHEGVYASQTVPRLGVASPRARQGRDTIARPQK